MTELEFSKLKFARALMSNNKCEKCGSSKDLQLHHKDGAYKTYSDLNPENYLLLCKDCHEKTFQAEDAKIQNDRNSKLQAGERYFFCVDFNRCESGYIIEDHEVCRIFFIQPDTGAQATLRWQSDFTGKGEFLVPALISEIDHRDGEVITISAVITQAEKNDKLYNNIVASSMWF